MWVKLIRIWGLSDPMISKVFVLTFRRCWIQVCEDICTDPRQAGRAVRSDGSSSMCHRNASSVIKNGCGWAMKLASLRLKTLHETTWLCCLLRITTVGDQHWR
eukprot:6746607-Karenia_brevis.AAC.1